MGCVAGSEYVENDVNDTKQDGGDIKYLGDIWQEFQYQKKLGQGATAEVQLVRHKTTNVLYALKMVNKKKESHFNRERKILGRLDCPNIVHLHGTYEDFDKYYFTMEFCSGGSLILRTAQREKYTEKVASLTVTMILKAVKYIHDMDIVHRDIKPENFVYLSDKDAALKMLDFGLALEIPQGEKLSYRAGTPYFMAPEVILNDEERSGAICKKSDIWAIGVVLYILLNGTAPFKGGNRDELFKTILFDGFEFRNKDLSSEAKDFIRKLLAPDCKKRITAAEALAHPWIMKGGQGTDEIMLSTAKALGYMHTRNAVHRALENLAIETMDEFDDKAMKQLFDRYDHNGDGNITKEEFVEALEARHIYRQKALEIADNILLRSDTNRDLMIQFEEFKSAMLRHQLTQDEYRMHIIFQTLDANKNGYITIDELANLPDSDDVHDLIKQKFEEADKDKDGQLSFDEFTQLLTVDDNLRNETMNVLSHEEELSRRINDNGHYKGNRV